MRRFRAPLVIGGFCLLLIGVGVSAWLAHPGFSVGGLDTRGVERASSPFSKFRARRDLMDNFATLELLWRCNVPTPEFREAWRRGDETGVLGTIWDSETLSHRKVRKSGEGAILLDHIYFLILEGDHGFIVSEPGSPVDDLASEPDVERIRVRVREISHPGHDPFRIEPLDLTKGHLVKFWPFSPGADWNGPKPPGPLFSGSMVRSLCAQVESATTSLARHESLLSAMESFRNEVEWRCNVPTPEFREAWERGDEVAAFAVMWAPETPDPETFEASGIGAILFGRIHFLILEGNHGFVLADLEAPVDDLAAETDIDRIRLRVFEESHPGHDPFDDPFQGRVDQTKGHLVNWWRHSPVSEDP